MVILVSGVAAGKRVEIAEMDKMDGKNTNRCRERELDIGRQADECPTALKSVARVEEHGHD